MSTGARRYEEIPTDFERGPLSTHIVGVVSILSLARLCRAVVADAEDVRNDVALLRRLTLRLHLESDLNVRQAFRVGILLGILAETLLTTERQSRSRRQ